MSTSTLKTRIVALLLGATLACGVSTAKAQFSPGAQQALIAMLNGASPYERGLIINALRALGPQRAEMELRQVSAMPPAVQQAMGRLVTQILQRLPRQYHQMFIDGVFDVSPQETQFVMQIARFVNSQVIGDRALSDQIAAWGADIRTMQLGAFQTRDNLLAQQEGGMRGALGPTTMLYDPNTGWRGEGYTAPGGTQNYMCPEYSYPQPSTSLPHVGCFPVYTR